jgi:hypothetical protein
MSQKPSLNFRRLSQEDVFKEITRLFRQSAHDRRLYIVVGAYEALHFLRDRLRMIYSSTANSEVGFVSLNTTLIDQLKLRSQLELATQLADERRDERLKRVIAETWATLLSQQLSQHTGLILADWELFFAYLGEHEIVRVRQMAINGKHICLLLPGAVHKERVWIFDQDKSARKEFPPNMIIPHWTFELI